MKFLIKLKSKVFEIIENNFNKVKIILFAQNLDKKSIIRSLLKKIKTWNSSMLSRQSENFI